MSVIVVIARHIMVKCYKILVLMAFLANSVISPALAKSFYGNYFPKLDGKSQYFKTSANYSNSTQITVEAWINLNSVSSGSAEPGIVVSSGGPDATEVEGSAEGAWMLYLSKGMYPAFRVREIQGRGNGGYLANLVAYDRVPVVKADTDSDSYSKNWIHIAATVKDNEVNLYVDGELSDRYVNNDAIDIRMLLTSHPVWVGLNPNLAIQSGNYLNGGIKGVRIWHTALTQDEIRKRVAGFDVPSSTIQAGNFRRSLDMYFPLDSAILDLASDATYQGGAEELDFYQKGEISNDIVPFTKDFPHIRITAPASGAGLMNKQGKFYEIRWLSYGFGNPATSLSRDLTFEYSMDGGRTWAVVRDKNGSDLAGVSAPDAENSSATWEPWRNNSGAANLRGLQSYCDTVILRARGTIGFKQDSFNMATKPFTVSTYTYAMKKTQGAILILPDGKDMSLTNSPFMIETWIKPYRFPATNEEYFPILAKLDSASGKAQFMLNLLPTGQIEMKIADNTGSLFSAKSDINKPVQRPNSIAIDTVWTHIAILYTNVAGKPDIRFYIDGSVQREPEITGQLSNMKSFASGDKLPLYIGYSPKFSLKSGSTTKAMTQRGYPGEIREIRYWKGIPNDLDYSFVEPSALTRFIQGAQSCKAENFAKAQTKNLNFLLSFSEGSMAHQGFIRALRSPLDSNVIVRYYGDPVKFEPVAPYIKMVEPVFKQKVRNSTKNLRLRWVGMDYDEGGFFDGNYPKPIPSLEFSIRGGGGSVIQAYKYVGSRYWQGNAKNSLAFPDDDYHRFKSNSNMIYAADLDVSMADPDQNKDNLTYDQGPLSATLTNARLRLTGQFTINSIIKKIDTESPIFTVTPESNFTVRTFLEGYHKGMTNSSGFRDLKATYAEGGIKLKLYADNNGAPGALLDSAESETGYESLNTLDRANGNNNFGNISFVFSELKDGRYWAKIEQLNHLPIMSRFPAPFKFKGDDKSTWPIESGWDFTSWNGTGGNMMKDTSDDIYANQRYTAGDSAVALNESPLSKSQLIFNNGLSGGSQGAIASMIGGDCNHDGLVDETDNTLVMREAGTSNIGADITGDGVVNADDRTIVCRNVGRGAYSKNLPKLIFEKRSSGPEIQVGTAIEVSGEIAAKDSLAYLSIYARNLGDKFTPGNCTFAFTYDTNVVKYQRIAPDIAMAYNGKGAEGYGYIVSKPDADRLPYKPGLRTVEIDFDSRPGKNFPGIALQSTKTLVGKLEFKILNKNAALIFAWDGSSTIHSIDGSLQNINTEYIPIKGMPLYKLKLTSPIGGEMLRPGQAFDIKWISDGKSAVYLNYTTNRGFDWLPVSDKPVRLEDGKYTWTIPQTESEECYVSMSDSASKVELGRSDSVFTIMAGFAQIISPSPGDAIYRGGATAKLRWTAKGYRKIRFEYSTNSGDSWLSATTLLNPALDTAQWKVPSATTKAALVRMLDENGVEVARTQPFRILGGFLLITTPKSGETLVGSVQTRIRWTAANVADFDLLYTSDGGKSWNRILPGTKGPAGFANWTPDNADMPKAGLKAIWNNDPEMEYDRVLPFIIKKREISVAEEIAGSKGLIYPNPCREMIKITLPASDINIDFVRIVDLCGKVCGKIFSDESGGINEQNALVLNTSGLETGCYVAEISCNGAVYKQMFIKVK